MLSRLLAKFNLKILIALTLLFVGLLPLLSSIIINLPMVTNKFEQLAGLERLHELEGRVDILGKAFEHRKENLRVLITLMGVKELFSHPAHRLLEPKKIKQRLGIMFSRWLPPDSGVQTIMMFDEAGAVVGNWEKDGNDALPQQTLKGIPAPDVVAGWLIQSKISPLGSVFVADIEQNGFDKETQHSHYPKVILGIPAENTKGTYAGAIFMRISLAPFIEKMPYDFIVTGTGRILHRYKPESNHADPGSYVHPQPSISEEFPDLLTTDGDSSLLILLNRNEQKNAFVKIVDDKDREHVIWLAHTVPTGELETWRHKFLLRFAVILTLLICLVLILAMTIAGKTEKMRQELLSGLTGLIADKEPLRLNWTWPVDVKELGKEIEHMAVTLVESEQRLRQNERFLASILDGIQDGISVHDNDYNIIKANQCMENWYREKLPLVGKKCYQVFHNNETPCDFCPSRDALLQGTIQRTELPAQDGDTSQKWLEVFAYPVRDEKGGTSQVVEFIRDITGKKQMEKERDNLSHQLAFSQKMEAVGTLAGGVAHDFNNILSAINGYAELCLIQMEKDNPFREKIHTILESGQRAAKLTQQLLAFSRKQILTPQDINVDLSLQGIRKMLTRILGEDIEINMIIRPDLWHIHADQTQFEQVLINLAVNARDAMPRGGNLTFEAQNVTLDQAYVERHYEIAAGEYVLIAISDSGQGMDKDTMAKIFEPFFTTKEKGKGTGLGLATVYGIVKQNNGEILVYSEPGQGSTFKIYLPRHQEAADSQILMDGKREMARGTETLLLVEDDEVVRTMAVEILSNLGYSILEAADGEEALQTCKRYHGRIELLLTDVVMPKLNGAELATKVMKLRPDIKVLFMSGYTDDAVIRHGILQDDVHFLQKPITPKILSETLRTILDNGNTKKNSESNSDKLKEDSPL